MQWDVWSMTNILGLQNLNVISKTQTEHAYYIDAESNRQVIACEHCFSGDFKGHGIKKQLFMDTQIHGLRTAITVLRKRFLCKTCGKTFMERLPDMDEKRLATKRLVTWVKKRALDHTFASVSHDTGLDEKTIRNIFKDYIIELEKQFKVATPRWLGIDECHLNKTMRCVITNIEHQTAVEMFEYRKQEFVATALYRMPDKDKVELITMDMWRPYSALAKAAFPNAKVVIDKFHVLKMANEALEDARKSLKKELNAKERKAMLGDRFVMLKRGKDLVLKEELKLEGILLTYPVLNQAYMAKEAFYSIWDADSKQKAIDLYESWRDGIPNDIRPYYSDLLRVMHNWEVEIFNYFDHPITNAYTECLNGLIKIMNRLGRGYSFDVLRAKVLFIGHTHKKLSKSIRSMRSEGNIPMLGLMRADDFIDLGTHIPTLLKRIDEIE
jgi:transposase